MTEDHLARLPYSRAMEAEADKVGLTLMVLAGYDGNEAPAVWERMGADAVSEFESTHPSHSRRISILSRELPVAERIVAKVSNGRPARQFLEKTLSIGGGIAGNMTLGRFDSDFTFDWSLDGSANVFLDSKLVELNLSIPFGDSANLLFGFVYKYPFPLTDNFMWFPAVGIDYRNSLLGASIGTGADFNITRRLFLRGIASVRIQIPLSDGEGFMPLSIPVRLGVGYALY
jgi:hypothetical protein